MTSYETRSSRNKSSASDQNDLKKLKSKYSAKLPTLKVLFSDWSDEDLLFVLDEANGDLDLTIDRISEGHASQWGEVKTKKSKKEAQKAKAAVSNTNQQQSTITYREPKTTPTKSYNDRVSRTGKASSNTTRTPKAKANNSSWDNQPKEVISSGSWASIASKQQVENNVSEDNWNTSNDTTTDEWGPSITSTTLTEPNSEDQPKTWASLLKSKPKPEPEPTVNETTETNNENNSTTEWDNSNNVNNSSWDAPNETVDESSTPVYESTPAETITEEKQTEKPLEPTKEEQEKPVELIEPVLKDEQVVVPTNDISLDAKFGSLTVEEEPPVEETVKETVVAEIAEEPVAQTTTIPASVTPASVPTTTAPVTNDTFNQTSTYLKQDQQQAYVQSNTPQQQQTQQQPQQTQTQQQPQTQTQQLQQQQQPQLQQQQPHIQQQPHLQPQQPQFGMDHLTSAYNSYLPNQPPTGASGFGMNPMGSLHDYSAYGTEAQRAAAAMGYYDATAFSHSPSVTSASAYPSRDKYTQDGLHGQIGQSQSIPQQQIYPPYYPQYYYIQGQYNAYQQSAAYGQPFMNKSMYPNVYQQQQAQPHIQAQQPQAQTGASKTTAATTTATTTASYSPYAQQPQLYNHQYDDLTMGLDYQKYSQPQNFLGNLNQQTPTTQKTNDISRAVPTSQPQPQQQPQQQYGNYFNQPQQMFGYGQYPQQHHQFPPQQQSRQSQYWNQ